MSRPRCPLKAGDRCGYLTCINPAVEKKGIAWLGNFLCDCGNRSVHVTNAVYNGRIQSCGCFWREQISRKRGRLDDEAAYMSWRAMKDRCMNPKHEAYHRYGGRGITICPEWVDSYETFRADMGPRLEGTTLDRIDPNQSYHPGNCRWATWDEQGRNKRNTQMLTVNGETAPLSVWAERCGIKYSTLWKRINYRGMEPEEALKIRD